METVGRRVIRVEEGFLGKIACSPTIVRSGSVLITNENPLHLAGRNLMGVKMLTLSVMWVEAPWGLLTGWVAGRSLA